MVRALRNNPQTGRRKSLAREQGDREAELKYINKRSGEGNDIGESSSYKGVYLS
jgi:hypothetical protein